MTTEIFRMLNVRPAQRAGLVPIEELAGQPPLLKALAPEVENRSLTHERLAAIVGNVAAFSLDMANASAPGRLGALVVGTDGDEDLERARNLLAMGPGDPRLAESAADQWLAGTLAATVLGRHPDAAVLAAAENVLRGLTALQGVAALGRDATENELRAALKAARRARFSFHDSLGIISALRSSSRPEEIGAARENALAQEVAAIQPIDRIAAADRLRARLMAAYAQSGQNQMTLLGVTSPPTAAASAGMGTEANPPEPQPPADGVVGAIARFLFGPRVSVVAPEPAIPAGPAIPADAISTRGAGALFEVNLSPGDRAFAVEVFGEGYPELIEDVERARQLLDSYRAAAIDAAQRQPIPTPMPMGYVIAGNRVIPTIAGRPGVRIAGIGDLIVVRESHKRYETEEIAHIENVLPTEQRYREHRKLRSSQSVFETETSSETETEEDLRTSDRYELQSEAEKIIKTEFAVDFGLNVTANYGFVTGSITVEADLGISYNRSVEERQRSASTLSSEVVNRSLERIQKHSRELRRTTLTETVEEINRHGLGGLAVPFSGIYKWVNKVQQVELRHFGKRLMVEFFVPEPAFRFLTSTASNVLGTPPEFDIDATALGYHNYMQLAARFGAVDVQPPPPGEVLIETSMDHNKKAEGPTDNSKRIPKKWAVAASKESIPTPAGYAPAYARAIVIGSRNTDYVSATVAVSGRTLVHANVQSGFDSGWIQLPNIAPRGDAGVAVAYSLHGDLTYEEGIAALHITIQCVRTDEAVRAWQLDTFKRLQEGSQRQWTDYREAQLTRATSQGSAIQGRDPLENRQIERDELKRSAIELMRGGDADLNAIDLTGPLPRIDTSRVDGVRNVVLFFEKAFEWEQMAYWFYPYFWGRRDQFAARLSLVDADPIHRHFLRSGAARVLAPVTPGYEERVLHYLSEIGAEDPKLVWMPDLASQAADPAGAIPRNVPNPDVWMEVILSKNRELAHGSGSLTVRNGRNDVAINFDSQWLLEDIDTGRELYIEGYPYVIESIAGSRQMVLDRPYGRRDNDAAKYLVASTRIGEPWEVVVPTNLVVLADQADKLNANANVNVLAPEDLLPNPAAGAAQ